MVVGLTALQYDPDQPIGHGLGIGENILCGQSDHSDAFVREPLVTGFITNRPFAHIMGYAVNFDRQLCLGAIEIQRISANRVLPAEFDSLRLQAEDLPEQKLGQ